MIKISCIQVKSNLGIIFSYPKLTDSFDLS